MPYLKVEDNFSATIVGNYSTTASTITLSNVPVAASAGWLTVYDFDGNQYEKIYFGGVSGSDITNILRGLSFTTNSQTEISGNKKELKNGMTVKLSVSQNYINDLTDVVNGTKEVGGLMKNPSSRTITDNRHIIDKEYADNLAIAGAPKATEAVYGIAKLSSAAADPTAPVVVNNEEVSASGGTGAGENKIVKANASGYIDKDYIELGADPGLEFVSNGLEAKIKTSGGLIKDANGLSADMGTTANKIVQLDSSAKLPAVDGSQLTNAVVFKTGNTTYDLATASGTQNIAHGLGKLPKFVKIKGVILTSILPQLFSETSYDGTTQTSLCLRKMGNPAYVSTNNFRISDETSDNNYQTGVITFDATNIIITWTKTGSPTGTFTMNWEAYS